METQELYASQALLLCLKVLSDKSTSPIDRAFAMCWLGNLVADVHHPCHSGGLYMENVFSEKVGDRGTNRIFDKQNGNLHAVWDGLLGREFDLTDSRRRIFEITNDAEICKDLKGLKGNAESFTPSEWLWSPQRWLVESKEYAQLGLYGVLGNDLSEGKGIAKNNPIDLSIDYLKMAGRIAPYRAFQASIRLAEQWQRPLHWVDPQYLRSEDPSLRLEILLAEPK